MVKATRRAEVTDGGAIKAHDLQAWWGTVPDTLQAQLRRAWKHPSGGLDRGAFECGSASALAEMMFFAFDLERAGKQQMAIDLVTRMVDGKVGQANDPGMWVSGCSWLAERHWRLGYESAERIRTEGIHNVHLKRSAEYGERAASGVQAEDVQSGKVISVAALDRPFMLYEIAGMSAEGCGLVRRLERAGLGSLVEVARYRDVFCLWPDWCRAIIAVQDASAKPVPFKRALEQAIASGAVPREAADVPTERLRSVAKSLRR